MGLFDGYADPQQVGEGGGLLGRLLALQRQQGQSLPDASFDQSPPAPNLTSQYRALQPVLGDRNAMLATVHPDHGRAILAQALANQQRSNSGNIYPAGYGQPVLSDVAPDSIGPHSQYAQALGLCATGPAGCAVGGGITADQAILGAAGLLGGATILNNQNKLPIPNNKPASTPTGNRRKESGLVPQIDRAGDARALIEGDDRNDLCFNRWDGEYGRCMRFMMPSPTDDRYVKACRDRANDRLSLCHRHGGTPDPEEPAEFSWYDIPRAPARR